MSASDFLLLVFELLLHGDDVFLLLLQLLVSVLEVGLSTAHLKLGQFEEVGGGGALTDFLGKHPLNQVPKVL